jgi:hypothetical protein
MPPTFHTVQYCILYAVYFFTQGRGGGWRVAPERNLKGQQFTKMGRKYNMTDCIFTDKKENHIFLIYRKSYMRKDFLIYEEMRKYFPIYEEAVTHI